MKDRKTAKEQAKKLVSQMTLEEKASQLKFDAPAIERLGVPAYNWWNEALHGVARAGTATVFPQAIGMAAMFDDELLTEIADAIATEARAKYNTYSKENDRDIYKGLTMWSPNINIFRDPRWGRGHETYGEDPYLTKCLGKAFVQGLQGDGEVLKTAACAKHFAVHSGPEAIRHEFDAVVSDKDLWETYLPAFEACVTEANVESVMGAYNRTNGEPCCAHGVLMEDILKDQWKFDGYYVSDCWAIRDFHEHHMVTKTATESAALALKKGCHVNCGNTYLHIMKAYQEGKVTEEDITNAAETLFTTRYMLGLLETSEYDQISYDQVESAEHRALARKATEKSVVMLKNDGLLPLSDSLKSIGVIGPNANSRAALIGNYHGTSSHYVTVLEGIQQAVSDSTRVFYSEGAHLFMDRVEHLGYPDDRIKEAVIVAKHSEVVVLCVGLDETLEGEEGDTGNSYASGDKNDLELPESQRKLVDAVLAVGKPTIICMMTGSAMNLSVAREKAGAILQTWYPGAEGGKAIADILFGKISPSGKLPVTFYESLKGLPEFTDYSMKGRTYRYIEEPAQYPFGYGLTYGDVMVQTA
ncbi:MAG: glycoside hydrolase family 3 protein, partial [Clostridia bacterium]|nr:glycoside hydrolase family 3 protein [Clostridia bacterium]